MITATEAELIKKLKDNPEDNREYPVSRFISSMIYQPQMGLSRELYARMVKNKIQDRAKGRKFRTQGDRDAYDKINFDK